MVGWDGMVGNEADPGQRVRRKRTRAGVGLSEYGTIAGGSGSMYIGLIL